MDVVGWYNIYYDDCDEYERSYDYCANYGDLADINGVANPVN